MPANSPATPPTVIRVSPMAHFAVGFLTLGLLIPVLTWPLSAPLLALPVVLSTLIVRLRTVAGPQTVTACGLLSSRTVGWDRVDGLRFTKGGWARAHLIDGEQLLLPAVTFATLPLLADASAGRVPNPYRR